MRSSASRLCKITAAATPCHCAELESLPACLHTALTHAIARASASKHKPPCVAEPARTATSAAESATSAAESATANERLTPRDQTDRPDSAAAPATLLHRISPRATLTSAPARNSTCIDDPLGAAPRQQTHAGSSVPRPGIHPRPFPPRLGALMQVSGSTARHPDAYGGNPPRRLAAPMHVSAAAAQQPDPAAPPAEELQPHRGPLSVYARRLEEGLYRPDPRQAHVMEKLQVLWLALNKLYPRKAHPTNLTVVDNVATTKKRSSWWEAVLHATDPHLGHAHEGDNPDRPRGLYMWGGVGVGKTMLMDVFVASAPHTFRLRRTHFHDFMLEVHGRLRKYSGEQDPLKKVADAIAAETRILALDELFVTDVSDAVILKRLFSRLWDRGLIVMATSNRRPSDLYHGGLQRHLFMPFIYRLEKECEVHDMASPTDYRQLATKTVGVYFVRLVEGRSNDDRLEHAFSEAVENVEAGSTSIEVAMGRSLAVPRAAGAACLFTFDELCSAAVGAPDYLALVSKFHTVALKGVPVFTAGNRNAAYRFVTLVDVMYEHKTKLLLSAEGYTDALFANILTQAQGASAGATADAAVVDDNLGFAKDRTVSRLIEMQTIEYAIAHAERHAPHLLLALQEAQSKRKTGR